LAFLLPRGGGGRDLTEHLGCYDVHGRRLPLPRPKGDTPAFDDQVRLAPGERKTLLVYAPSEARLARPVFYHHAIFPAHPADVVPLNADYFCSQHLRLPARK